MTRRVENAVILDGRAAMILSQAARLPELRVAVRGRDDQLYALLNDIAVVANTYRTSVEGKGTGNATELREPEYRPIWTPAEIAKQIPVHPRTVRNDIERGLLRAQKSGRIWAVTAEDATTYIESRRTP